MFSVFCYVVICAMNYWCAFAFHSVWNGIIAGALTIQIVYRLISGEW